MKLNKSDVGKLALVKWDDIGRVDSMIVEVDDDRKGGKLYDFNSRVLQSFESSQVVEINGYVTPNSILESLVNA